MLRSKVSRRLPPLHALRAFEAAARHLSVKKAAAELAVTPTAVSHHIRVLEDALGVRLFERHARHIALTAYGRDLYPALREGFDKFADAISRLKAGKLRTVVTWSATFAFTARWLAPRVPAFHRDNPGMDLRLHASDEPVDLRSGIADAAIRYGRGEYEGYAAETLFEDAYAPVCSPRLRLREPRDLAKHTMIHFEWRRRRREDATWDRWLRAARVPDAQIRTHLYGRESGDSGRHRRTRRRAAQSRAGRGRTRARHAPPAVRAHTPDARLPLRFRISACAEGLCGHCGASCVDPKRAAVVVRRASERTIGSCVHLVGELACVVGLSRSDC